MIIDKRYTIRFIKSGIRQYADFNEKDGELINPKFYASWVKDGEIPDVSSCKKIEEVLEKIKEFSYNKIAEIYLINGNLAFYDSKIETKKMINSIDAEYETFMTTQINKFFKQELVPYLEKNNWYITNSMMGAYILVKKNEEGEFDNIRKVEETDEQEEEFEYLCAKLLIRLNLMESLELKSESGGRNIFASHILFRYVDDFLGYFTEIK